MYEIPWQGILAASILILSYIYIFSYLFTREKRLRKRWRLIAEGEVVKVVDRTSKVIIYLGIAGQRSSPLSMTISTIFFKDDTTVKVMGMKNLPPPGTYIKVFKNPLPEFKIEIIESKNCL